MLQTINGILRQTNLPDESEEYLSKREELRLAEIELRNQRGACRGSAAKASQRPRGAGLHTRGGSCESGFWRFTDPNGTPRPTIHRIESVCRSLSPHVRQKTDKAMPNVHRLDRRFQRHRASPRPKRGFCDRRRSRFTGSAKPCSRARVGPIAPSERRFEYIQIRPRKRRQRRKPGFGDIGLHSRQ